MDHLINNPFRTADHSIECPECSSIFTWNTEDGLTGQTCGCGHVFTEDDAERQTIDITPEGCKTPEGAKRVNEAMKTFGEAREEVARLATSLIRNDTIVSMMRSVLEAHGEDEAIDQLDSLSDAVEACMKAEEAFLRAVSGAPDRPKLKTYPAKINGKVVRVTIPENEKRAEREGWERTRIGNTPPHDEEGE